jgi:hypothetical protein
MASRDSPGWPKYDPHPLPPDWRPKFRIRIVPSDPEPIDAWADYIENGAEWWLARSERNVPMLLHAFDQGDVACLLYERVGAMIELRGTSEPPFWIALQLVRTRRDWALDVSLSDAGIYVEDYLGSQLPKSWTSVRPGFPFQSISEK